MYSLFLSSLLALTHYDPYPTSPERTFPPPFLLSDMPNVTEPPLECLRADMLHEIIQKSSPFRQKLVQDIASTSPGENFVISPLAVSILLSLLNAGTTYGGKMYVTDYWGIPTTACFEKFGMQPLVEDLENYKGMGLYVANGVFKTPKVAIRPQFIEIAEKTFHSTVQTVDFEDSTVRNNVINGWYETNTQGRVKNVLKSMNISQETTIAFESAVYFKGEWLNKFDVSDTQERSFYNQAGIEKKLPTMSTKGYFNYGRHEKINATFVELPYESKNDTQKMSMFIILPDETTDLNNFIDEFENVTIKEFIDKGSNTKVHVQLPKLTIEDDIDVKSVIDEWYDLNTWYHLEIYRSKFKDIVKKPRLRFDKLVQKTIIEIDEGSSKGGVNGTGSDSSFSDAITFFANRTFYIMICIMGDNPQNIISARFTG